MKKTILLTLLIFNSIIFIRADEGFWLPFLLGQKTYDDMVKKGLTLTKQQIWDLNNKSLKDGIGSVNGGCSGTIIGKNGLFLTAHHCVTDDIGQVSSTSLNIVKQGYIAASQKDELPLNTRVSFLKRFMDVTSEVKSAIGTSAGSERQQKLVNIVRSLQASLKKETGYRVSIHSFFNGLQYLAMMYEDFNDVRLVATPPNSLAFFGGDTDNFEYPRHTIDFAVLRIYADSNKPAAYSPYNQPYTDNQIIPVSNKGVKENDFTFIMGYPSVTNRFVNAEAIKQEIEINSSYMSKLYERQIKFISERIAQSADEAVYLIPLKQSIANSQKLNDGKLKQLYKNDLYQKKLIAQQNLLFTSLDKEAADKLIEKIKETYEQWNPYQTHWLLLNRGFTASDVFMAGQRLEALSLSIKENRAEDTKKILKRIEEIRKNLKTKTSLEYELKWNSYLLHSYFKEVPTDQHPDSFYTKESSKYGNPIFLKFGENFIRNIYKNGMLFNDELWNSFNQSPTEQAILEDPSYKYFVAFAGNYRKRLAQKYASYLGEINSLNEEYLKVFMDFDKNKEYYPDANGTLRISYGKVKSIRPSSGILIEYFCGIKGILEKYKKGDEEFDAPDEIIDAIKKDEFNKYKDDFSETINLSFISTADIVSGNSGSPICNGKGELIGIVFDYNKDALATEYQMNNENGRSISVDVRAILWYLDEIKNAKYVLDDISFAAN